MNPEQLKEYKREKSKKFNANLRELRLKDKEKKRTADQQPDNQGSKQGTAQGTAQGSNQGNLQGSNQGSNQGNLQGSNQGNQPDGLTLQDLMDIYETLDTKMDIIQNKLETIMENKLDLIDNKLETIMENKLEKNQPIKQQPSIFFA